MTQTLEWAPIRDSFSFVANILEFLIWLFYAWLAFEFVKRCQIDVSEPTSPCTRKCSYLPRFTSLRVDFYSFTRTFECLRKENSLSLETRWPPCLETHKRCDFKDSGDGPWGLNTCLFIKKPLFVYFDAFCWFWGHVACTHLKSIQAQPLCSNLDTLALSMCKHDEASMFTKYSYANLGSLFV